MEEDFNQKNLKYQIKIFPSPNPSSSEKSIVVTDVEIEFNEDEWIDQKISLINFLKNQKDLDKINVNIELFSDQDVTVSVLQLNKQ